jgi:hypothetical protein
MEVTYSPKTLVTTYETAQSQNSEDYYCQPLKPEAYETKNTASRLLRKGEVASGAS